VSEGSSASTCRTVCPATPTASNTPRCTGSPAASSAKNSSEPTSARRASPPATRLSGSAAPTSSTGRPGKAEHRAHGVDRLAVAGQEGRSRHPQRLGNFDGCIIQKPHIDKGSTRDRAGGIAVEVHLPVEFLHGFFVDPAGQAGEDLAQGREAGQSVVAHEGRGLVDGEELQIVLEQNQIVVGDLPVGGESLQHLDGAVEKHVVELRPPVGGDDFDTAEAETIAADHRPEAVQRPTFEIRVDADGKLVRMLGQIGDALDPEAGGHLAAHHDAVIVGEAEAFAPGDVERRVKFFHPLLRGVAIDERGLAEHDEAGTVIFGVEVDIAALQGLHIEARGPEPDQPGDWNALGLCEDRHHLRKHLAFAKILAAHFERVALLAAGENARRQEDRQKAGDPHCALLKPCRGAPPGRAPRWVLAVPAARA
jgi:hypothetical protein